MIYYVSSRAPKTGCGTEQSPFLTISEAAEIAKAGDEVLVAPGIYRESVNPRHGGTETAPIVYRSVQPLQAVITGAEPVKNWKNYSGDVWVAKIPNGIFGSYNPYTTVLFGDWFFSLYPLHTGEVYLNEKSMYEMPDLEKVLNPVKDPGSWEPENSVYTWFTEQKEGNTVIYANFRGKDPNAENVEINVRRNCFFPSDTGRNYITVSGFSMKQAATTWAPPTAFQDGLIGTHWSKGWIIEDCEISNSKCSGISLGKYYQPENENKWTLKRVKNGTQTERDAICQAQLEGWSKEKIGSHIVRRCHIHHCEQTGIVGHLGGVFSLIEDNHIHHINNKQQLLGAEIGGIKMHAAIDTTIRRNHIHHCTRGLWLDWQAQGTRVSRNLFHDNTPPVTTEVRGGLAMGEDVFVEVSHGPTLIDNNIMLSVYSCRLATQGVALVHNLLAGPFTSIGRGTNNANSSDPRYTPYHVPHRTEIAGFMTFLHGDDRFYNNVFLQRPVPAEYQKTCDAYAWADPIKVTGTKPFDGYPTEEEYRKPFFNPSDAGVTEDRRKYYTRLPVYTGGNVFLNGAQHCDTERNFMEDDSHEVYVQLREKEGHLYLDTNVQEYIPQFDTDVISTEVLGEAFEPEEKFENPDGTEIIFNQDFFGHTRSINPLAGPFADRESYLRELF